jgi:uncharacterized protein (DUF427 family)
MESVWSYPERPTLEPERRSIRVEFACVVVAETSEAIRLLERGLPPSFYIPPHHTRTDLLVACEETSLCPVKGESRYWTIRVREREADRAAWSYSDPLSGCEPIHGYFAFYADRVDRCLVGRDVARGRENRFYAGWITSEIEGPFVGDPNLPEHLSRGLPRPVISQSAEDTFEEVAARSFSIGRRYLPPGA